MKDVTISFFHSKSIDVKMMISHINSRRYYPSQVVYLLVVHLPHLKDSPLKNDSTDQPARK